VGETLAETRVEIEARRTELEGTAAQLRDALDIRKRFQENPAGAKETKDLVRNRVVGQGNLNHVLLRRLNGFADGLGNFLGFAAAESDMAAFVTDDNQGAEAQILPALHHFGDAVDVDDGVL